MAEIYQASGWKQPGEKSSKKSFKQTSDESIKSKKHVQTVSEMSAITGTELWHLSDVAALQGTSNLDKQKPETLYFLERVANIPLVVEAYVEHRPNGKRKHWTVISERDFDVMDEIYCIEQDVLDRFPGSNIQFRVTVQTGGGPSISSNAHKIYEDS